jgi:hypothetical protein
MPRFAVSVVLPTPPLPEQIRMKRVRAMAKAREVEAD